MNNPGNQPGPHPERVSTRAMNWAVGEGKVDDVFAAVESKLRRRRRRRLGGLSAAGVMILVGVAWWGPQRHTTTLDEAKSAGTSQGSVAKGPRLETLPDGTVVEVRDGAEMSVAFTDRIRRVRLERGEAHFQVIKDAARPFVVEAGGVEVRAVGTAFSVDLTTAAIEVIVTAGKVAVELPSGPDAAAKPEGNPIASLEAGHRVRVGRGADAVAVVPVVAITAAEMAERLAWRVPRLELSGTPLNVAIAFFNHHSATKVVLATPELGRLQLSGTLRADSVEPLLALLHVQFGVEAERRSGEILLRKGL